MKNWFIKKLKRHPKTADKPYITSGLVLAFLSIFTLVLFSLSLLQFTLVRHPNLAAVIAEVLVDLTNGDRSSFGVSVLATSPELTLAAQAKADDMALNGYFSHISPDGTEPWHWIKEAGYSYQLAGENLAINFSDSAQVERAWLDSFSHRANILNDKFTEVGIATSRGAYQGRDTVFVVQMFGTPKEEFTLVASVTSPPPDPTPLTPPQEVEETETVSTVDTGSVLAETNTTLDSKSVPWWNYLIASPWTYSRYIYLSLGLLIILAVIGILWFELRQGHIKHSLYSFFLGLAFLTVLYFVNSLLFSEPILTTTGLLVSG